MKHLIKMKKDTILLIVLSIILIVLSFFSIYLVIETHNWVENLPPEERQDLMLKQARNYNESFIEGTVVSNDSYMTWVKRPIYNIYLTVSFEDEEMEVSEFQSYSPELYILKKGDNVKCKLVTITNGYDETVNRYIDSNYIEYVN